ncbi:MAG: hypothetical protein JW931_09505 [Methanomicrobiaceae archaeon]|nr:hypothetical protein [Methanomicrobiaceae archaeon]
MANDESSSKPFFDEFIEGSKINCSKALNDIEEKLKRLNKLEIISRLSILTKTEIGKYYIADHSIFDLPCLNFVIGLALKNEFCSDVKPSNEDIDLILKDLQLYFLHFLPSMMPTSGNKENIDDVIFHAQMHALIKQLNPEKYPFQMKELLLETFGKFEEYFSKNFGFTITDVIIFSEKIIQQYENLIIQRISKINHANTEPGIDFFSKTGDLLAIDPEDFCKSNCCDIIKFKRYLDVFSCHFGEGSPTYNSPLDENIFLKKPILCYNGRYFAPIPQDLFQNLPLIFEGILEEEKRKNSKVWQKYQGIKAKFTEKKVTEYLGRVFEKEKVHENLFYPIGEDKTAEVDHIIPYSNYIIIAESKSGNFTITPKKEGINRISTNLKKLVCEAHNQGLRAKEYIKTTIPATFTNSRGKKILEIEYKEDITRFILINVTLEPLLSFSSSLKNIESLGLFSQSELPWSVNLFELDILTRCIDSPAVFLHYIERRLSTQETGLFAAFDELSFLGLYLDRGNFNIYLDDGSIPTQIHLDTEFLEAFDEHYLHGGELPKLTIEKEISDIIHELEQLHPERFINITNTILDLSHETRKSLIEYINKIIFLSTTDGKRHDFSLMTEVKKTGITVFAQIGTENLYDHLSSFCLLKKYQSKADCWIGLGIDVLDTKRFINTYLFYDEKWKRDKRMDKTIKFSLEKGIIKAKPDFQN